MTSTMTRVAAADIAPGDTSKHVKYTFGMLLGVDDFTQEFTYLSARDRWLARDLHGYGTVWGLSVAIERAEGGLRVNVDRGVGITPLGELVCVPSMQCAYLEPWLVKHSDEVAAALPDPAGGTVPVHVVLCYRARATDNVPIPGEPCRSEDELTAPSRWQDDFELELRLTPPAQVEERAIRDFAALLRRVPVVSEDIPVSQAFIDRLRDATRPATGSPPHGTFEGTVHPDLKMSLPRLTEYLRVAFRLWVTEVRPQYRLDVGCGADECPPEDADGCLLLGTLELPVSTEGEPARLFLDPELDVEMIDVREGARPYLLHTRMLQEWLLGSGQPEEVDGSPPAGGTSPGGGTTPPASGAGMVVAAGRVDGDDASDMTKPTGWSWNDLRAELLDDGAAYRLSFNGFEHGRQYVVKGTPILPRDTPIRILEVIPDEEVAKRDDADRPLELGIYVRLADRAGKGGICPFMVEISDFSERV